jgi:hypothetical protein
VEVGVGGGGGGSGGRWIILQIGKKIIIGMKDGCRR